MRWGTAVLALVLIVAPACSEQPQADFQSMDGEEIYRLHCQVCHGSDGSGISGQCPPFQGSTRLADEDRRREILEIMLLGKVGEVERGEELYRGVMPAWRNELGNRQIADVLNYIRSRHWGVVGRPFEAAEVEEARVRAVGKAHFSN
jgi:mono/diheme cytochrome c family protein